jgi:hypothetical protein
VPSDVTFDVVRDIGGKHGDGTRDVGDRKGGVVVGTCAYCKSWGTGGTGDGVAVERGTCRSLTVPDGWPHSTITHGEIPDVGSNV